MGILRGKQSQFFVFKKFLRRKYRMGTLFQLKELNKGVFPVKKIDGKKREDGFFFGKIILIFFNLAFVLKFKIFFF